MHETQSIKYDRARCSTCMHAPQPGSRGQHALKRKRHASIRLGHDKKTTEHEISLEQLVFNHLPGGRVSLSSKGTGHTTPGFPPKLCVRFLFSVACGGGCAFHLQNGYCFVDSWSWHALPCHLSHIYISISNASFGGSILVVSICGFISRNAEVHAHFGYWPPSSSSHPRFALSSRSARLFSCHSCFVLRFVLTGIQGAQPRVDIRRAQQPMTRSRFNIFVVLAQKSPCDV